MAGRLVQPQRALARASLISPITPTAMTKPVFISYSTDDTAAAEQIRDGLESGDGNVAGIGCWMAPRDIAPGLEYGSQIVTAIEECSVLVLLLSESSNRSRFVLNEVERAVSKDKIVIPVRIHNVTPSRSLEFFISNAQWIDAWQGPLDTQLAPLATAIRNRLAPADAQDSDDPTPASTASPTRRVLSNLPAQLTRFIGRERAIAEVKGLLESTRLLTLTGSGGTGKTRLALEVAAAVVPRFADGVWLVELAALSDGAMVATTIATVFGLPSANQSTLSMLAHYLREKRLLLLLDNCEHLIDSCAQVADALLRACPELHILATSREGLGVAGELAWPVPSLQMPDADVQLTPSELATFEAVHLFIDRAALVAPDFALSAANAVAVRQICARLDGIPLAIELAAARVKTLSVQDIVTRLSDRFRLLTGGSRTVLPRHQTLRALIDWSYRLLTEAERSVLRRLAIFAGGWTLEAAEAVCSGDEIDAQDVLDLLTRLVDKSLVVLDARSEVKRYTLLETIRQYLVERLEDAEESASVRNRHLDYILLFGERAAPQMRGEVLNDRFAYKPGHGEVIDQVALYTRLAFDMENIRRAVDWAAETGRIDEGLRVLIAFGALFIVRAGQKEMLARLQAVLAEYVPPDLHTHSMTCLWIANLYQRQAEPDLGRVWLDRAGALIAQLDNPALQFSLLAGWVFDAQLRGDYGLAHSYHRQRQDLAVAHAYFGMDKEAVEDELMWYSSILLWTERDYLQALPQIVLVHAHAVKLGDLYTSTSKARLLGYALLNTGNLQEAAARFRESMLGNFAMGDKQAVAACLVAWAALAVTQEDYHRAARLFGASKALQEAIYTPITSWDAEQVQPSVETLRQKLPAPELDEHWAAGRAMSMEQTMDYALTSYPSEQK